MSGHCPLDLVLDLKGRGLAEGQAKETEISTALWALRLRKDFTFTLHSVEPTVNDVVLFKIQHRTDETRDKHNMFYIENPKVLLDSFNLLALLFLLL